MVFYNRNGIPIAYDEDGIYLFSGRPVAYIYQDTVFNYSGKQLGWFSNGWIRDLSGRCVFFSDNATGFGPLKPLKRVIPKKALKMLKPLKGVRQVKHVRALDSMAWSPLSGEVFFSQ